MLKSLPFIFNWSRLTEYISFSDDISDDDLQELSRASLQRSAAEPSYDGRPMDQSLALVGDLHPC